MIKLIIVLAFGLAVVSCGKQVHERAASPAATTKSYTVVRAVDGDTIKVSVDGQEESVRLIGIDTPETHKPGVKVECGGKEASANMAKLAPEGATARLTFDSSQDREDRYGRLLAYVNVHGRNLQREQLYSGLAEVYVYGGKPFKRVESFRRAEEVAKGAHRGVWGECSGDFHSEQPAS